MVYPVFGLVLARSAVVVAAAVSATTAAAASAAKAARFALLHRTRFVDDYSPAAEIGAVELGNSRCRLFIGRHFHEAEAFAAAGELVHDDSGSFDSAYPSIREMLANLIVIDGIGQVADKKFLSHSSL